jgi:hypothetical protein
MKSGVCLQRSSAFKLIAELPVYKQLCSSCMENGSMSAGRRFPGLSPDCQPSGPALHLARVPAATWDHSATPDMTYKSELGGSEVRYICKLGNIAGLLHEFLHVLNKSEMRSFSLQAANKRGC